MKILLADDYELFSEGFSLLLRNFFHNSSITQASSWYVAKEQASKMHFDLAILDLFMPANNSWELELAELIASGNTPNISILTSSIHPNNVQQAFALGVRGYIHKSSSLAEIHKALNMILDNKIYLPPQLQQHSGKTSNSYGSDKLTKRQYKILEMLSQGKGNRQIATELEIKESTVKRHIYNIFQQLGATSRTEAVHIAYQQGLLQSV